MTSSSAPRIAPASHVNILAAGKLIREGRLVGFPTETVYGLGGDATNDAAVAAIYAAKGRPSRNPLIVHFHDRDAAMRAALPDDRARRLADRFWPGVLTLVLRRRPSSEIVERCSAGLPTVAVRVPEHPVARAFLQLAACPVAAPSANRAGLLSPTEAQHVADSMGAAVDLILDDGPAGVGLESTVLDVSETPARLLRPGAVLVEEIEGLIGPVERLASDSTEAPRSPGMLSRHYAPELPIRLDATDVAPSEALLAFGPREIAGAATTLNLSPTGDLEEAAHNFYGLLRRLDRSGCRGIAVMPIPATGLGAALNDRLRRAASTE